MATLYAPAHPGIFMAVKWGGRGPVHFSRYSPAPVAGSGPPPASYHLTLEDGSGALLLETGDYLLLEDAP